MLEFIQVGLICKLLTACLDQYNKKYFCDKGSESFDLSGCFWFYKVRQNTILFFFRIFSLFLDSSVVFQSQFGPATSWAFRNGFRLSAS